MSLKEYWSDFRRRWFGSSSDDYLGAVGILSRCYEQERQHVLRFRRHAEKMHYPQFRQTLARIAAEADKHADLLAEKIKSFGVRVPEVMQTPVGSGNSWSLLLQDLEEERRSAERLYDQMRDIGADFPDILEILHRIDQDNREHRAAIREILMRSDPQAMSEVA